MKHTVNNNRPWLDKAETLVISADCTEVVRETVERVRVEKLDSNVDTEPTVSRKRSKRVETTLRDTW